MTVIKFPSPTLTDEDEQAIIALVLSNDNYFSVRRGTDQGGRPCFMLLNKEGSIRGYVVKTHGVYGVLDARGAAVVETRSREQALTVLTK